MRAEAGLLALLSLTVAGLLAPLSFALAEPITPAPHTELRTVRVELTIPEALDRLPIAAVTRLSLSATVALVPVYLPAERLRALPPVRQPSELREAFVGDFSPGGYAGLQIRVNGRPCEERPGPIGPVPGGPGPSGPGPIGPGPGGREFVWCLAPPERTLTVEVEGELMVPERLGSVGRVGHLFTIGGAWIPTVAWPGVAPAPMTLELGFRWPHGLHAFVAGRWLPSPGEGGQGAARSSWTGADPPIVLRPPTWHATRLARGRAVVVASTTEREGRDALDRPFLRELERGLTDLLDHRERALGLVVRPSDPLVVIEAPLGHALAEVADGVLFVSERAFRMLDVDRFLRFHRLAVLADAQVVLELARLPRDRPLRRMTAELRAASSLEAFVRDAYGGRESPYDLLSLFAFIPSVDAMLYAPDLPFAEAYFQGVDPDDPWVPDLVDAPAPPRRARLLHGKLFDRLGAAAIAELDARLAEGVSPLEALRAIAGPRFVETWMGPHPQSRHALTRVSSKMEPGGETRVDVEVTRYGEGGGEPVAVRIVDEDGRARVLQTPIDPEPREVLTTTLAGPLGIVELDPLGRLQDRGDDEQPSPRYLHRDPPRWKVLLNNFNFQLAATEGAVQTAVDLTAARIWDTRWSYGLRAELAQDAVSGTVRTSYGFGRPVTPARRVAFLTAFLEGGYLRPGFGGALDEGAAVGGGFGLGWDDRVSVWAPESGTSLRLTGQLQKRIGAAAPGIDAESLSISVRATRQWQLALQHQLTLRVTGGAFLFGRPEPQLRFALGGRSGVRGYALDAEVGRVRATAHVEWLHPLAPRFDLNGFFLAWVTGLQGALFADVGVLGDDWNEAWRGPAFADVGYGLRVLIDYLGVRPGVLAVELAFPLVRTRDAPSLGPPAVYVGFSQSFAGL